MIYDSVFQKLLASIFSFDFTLCVKSFYREYKVFTHIKLTVIVVKSLDVSFELLFGQEKEGRYYQLSKL